MSGHGGAVPGGWSGGPVRTAGVDLLTMLDGWVRTQPDAVALELPATGEALTYLELGERVAAAAGALSAHRGRVVAVRMERELTPLVRLLGAMAAGAVPLAVDPALPDERVAEMVEDAAAVVLAGDLPAPAAPPGTAAPVVPEGAAYVVFTSGSSGRPKGVFVPHAGLASAALGGADWFGLGPGRRLLHAASWSFDAAWWELSMVVASGATLVVAGLEALEERLTDGSVDAVLLTPTVASWVAGHPLRVTTLGLGGEAPAPGLVARLRRMVPRVLNCYGPAEASICVAIAECAAGTVRPPVGRPLPGVRAYVLDDARRPVAEGEVGELYLAGACVGLGYLGDAARTAAAFVPDPFQGAGAVMYGTGDRATLSSDGVLTVLGRVDSQVKLRGVRIELGEVEATVRGVDGIQDCCASLLPGGDVLGVAVVPSGAAPDDLAARVARACRARLHDAMVPRVVELVDRLPSTHGAKVDRARVAAVLDAAARRAEDAAPRAMTSWADPVEAVVAELFDELCAVPPAGPDDTFLACGGTSLDAARVAAALRRRYGVAVGLADVMRAGTVPAVAAHVAHAERLGHAAGTATTVDAHSPAPASAGESRLWHLWRADPGGNAYVVPVRLRLTGRVDADRLARAVDRVLAHHGQLHARYEEDVHGAVLRRTDVVLPPTRVVDLADAPDAQERADALLQESRTAPFDLRTGPLVRSTVVRVTASSVVLALDAHHAVTDGASSELLLDQVLAAYADGAAPPTAEPYASYVRWQQQSLAGGREQQLADEWRRYLDGAPDHLELPFTHPRRESAAHSTLECVRDLPTAVADRLSRLAAQTGSSLYHLLLTTLGAQLARCTGQDEVLVAALRGDRPTDELASTVGFFVSTVPVRVRVDPRATVREAVEGVRESALTALGLADLPFEQVVQVVSPRRVAGSTPLVQVALNLVELHDPVPPEPGVAVAVDHQLAVDSKFDLTVYAHPGPDGLRLRLAFREDLVPAAWANEIADQLATTLTGLADREPSARFPAVDSEARRALAAEAALPVAAVVPPAVVGTVRDLALADADRPAVSGAHPLSRGDVRRRVEALRAVLDDLGVRRGHVVAVVGRRDASLPVAVLALLEAAVAFSVVDPHLPSEAVRDLLTSLRPAAVLHPVGEDVLDGPHHVVLDATGAVLRSVRQDERWQPAVLEPDVAYVAHTSGTTGTPKQVLASADVLDRHVAWERDVVGAGPGTRCAFASGTAYDPCLRDLLVPLAAGGVLAVPDEEPSRDVRRFVEWLRRERVTLWHTTPGLLAAVVAAAEVPLLDLRAVLVGGEPWSAEQAQDARRVLPHARLLDVYGTTETPQVAGALEVGTPTLPARHVAVGTGTPTSRLLVLDADGRPAAPGELGELVVASPWLALRYGSGAGTRPLRTRVTGVAEQVYRTGDLARAEPNGVVHVVGRADQQVKVAGVRVEPGAIEQVAAAHPGVREVCVRPRSTTLGVGLVALVVPEDVDPAHEDAAALARGLEAVLRRRLPEVVVPTVVLVPQLVVGRTGKVDVEATCATAAPVTAEVDGPGPDEWETRVADAWEELLGTRPASVDDDFFRLGGHSLLAVRLLARLGEESGIELGLPDFFAEPTVAGIARRLRRATEHLLRELSDGLDDLDALLEGIE